MTKCNGVNLIISLFDRGSSGSADNPKVSFSYMRVVLVLFLLLNINKVYLLLLLLASKSFIGQELVENLSDSGTSIRGTVRNPLLSQINPLRSFDTLHDPSDLGSLILIQIYQGERTLKFLQISDLSF